MFNHHHRAIFTWLSKGIGFGFTTPFGWLVYLLWFWFYDSQVKTALTPKVTPLNILCFLWQSAIVHPRNNKKKKREKDKSIVEHQQNVKTNSDILCFIAKY